MTRSVAVLHLLLVLAGSCQGDPTGNAGGGVRERWYEAQPGHAFARPAILGDLAYFGTGEGQLIAREVRTGAKRWAARLSGSDAIRGGELLVRSGVVVVPVIGHASGVDAATGLVLWNYITPRDTVGRGPTANPGQMSGTVAAADDQTVYLPAWGASVSAVDIRTGVARWVWTPGRFESDTAASIFRSGAQGVALSGDTVFVTGWHFVRANGAPSETWLAALDRTTGRELWRTILPVVTAGVGLAGAPTLFGNRVILSTLRGDVWAVDRTTQRIVWHFVAAQARYILLGGVQLADGVVYTDGGDERLYALDAATGAVRWVAEADVGAGRNLLVTPRRVYFPKGLSIIIFDRASGRRIVDAPQPRTSDGLIAAPPAFANGQVFVSVADAAWSFDEP